MNGGGGGDGDYGDDYGDDGDDADQLIHSQASLLLIATQLHITKTYYKCCYNSCGAKL